MYAMRLTACDLMSVAGGLIILLTIVAAVSASIRTNADEYTRNGVVSLNILNGGFTDGRIQYNSANLPSGPLFEYLKTDVAPFHNVLAMQELNGWTDNDMRRVSEALGYTDFYLCKNCNRYKVGFMTRDTLETLVDISSAGSGAIAIRTSGVVYATLHLSAASGTGRTSQVHSAVDNIVAKYGDEPLLLMGDFNSLSPEDASRYSGNVTCGGRRDSNY